MENAPPVTDDGEKLENTSIKAKYFAFRDVNIYKEKSLYFSTPNLSAYSSSKYPQPTFTEAAFNMLLTNRILVVANGTGFDKNSFIRHLAYLVLEQDESLKHKELIQNEEKLSLFKSLKSIEDKSVFIIDQAHPRLFDYDLSRFLSITKGGHFIIITTDINVETWALSPAIAGRCWFEIPEGNKYSETVLSEFLGRELKRMNAELPISIKDSLSARSKLISDLSIADVANRFNSPNQISLFLHLLKEVEEPSLEKFENLIKVVIDDHHSQISIWYRNLGPQEQLIALGVALLEGMYDDQFFTSMQDIVNNFWQYRDPFLLSLDYCDIEFILPFYEIEDINEEKRLIRSRYSEQRTEIITIAWNSYRRHILSSLPLLKQMISDTISAKELNWEKFGTRDRRMILRQAIGNTISDIGLISFHTVEGTLLELASYQETTVQRVAAKAMARWREFDRDDLFFNTLTHWQQDDRVIRLMASFRNRGQVNNTDDDTRTKALSYIKATAVLSLAYAANYDRPNQLEHRFIKLLHTIAMDRDKLATSRLCESLPRIIHHHSLQLIDVLEDFIVIDELQTPIAEGLALAYEDYPKTLKETLFSWLESAMEKASEENRRQKLTYGDKIVATILETFQRIQYTNTAQDAITLDEVFGQLTELWRREERANLIRVIRNTASHLIAQHFDVGKVYLTTLYDFSNRRDRNLLMQQLLIIYVDQRKLQYTNSNYTIRIEGETIPAWLQPTSRPLTPIEELMLQWVDSSEIEIKKLGNSAFIYFIDHLDSPEQIALDELQEQIRLKQELEKQRRFEQALETAKLQSEQEITNTFNPSFYKIFSLWKRIQVYFFLLGKPREQRVLFKELFKNILFDPSYRPQYKLDFLEKLHLSSDPLTIKMSKWFERFLK